MKLRRLVAAAAVATTVAVAAPAATAQPAPEPLNRCLLYTSDAADDSTEV